MRDMPRRFVYVLRNADDSPRYYTGLTSDVATRLMEHNAGSCIHTAKYRPWSIDVVIEFGEERRALAFERYLKSGSGVAFAQRHLR
jgi:putative endonuclease